MLISILAIVFKCYDLCTNVRPFHPINGLLAVRERFYTVPVCALDRLYAECRKIRAHFPHPSVDFSLRHSWNRFSDNFSQRITVLSTEKCAQPKKKTQKKRDENQPKMIVSCAAAFHRINHSFQHGRHTDQMKWQRKSWNHFDCILNMGIYLFSTIFFFSSFFSASYCIAPNKSKCCKFRAVFTAGHIVANKKRLNDLRAHHYDH